MSARIVLASDPAAVDAAAEALGRGSVVAIPTETVYGLAALPLDGPLGRLVAIKQRSPDKGIALLIDAPQQMGHYAIVPAAAERLAKRFWPGPLTLVLDLLPDAQLSPLLTGGRPTIGLRLPDHELPRALCRRLGPIAASSANVSGEPDATTAQAVAASLGAELELIVDDGPVRGGLPSTVVGFDGRGEPLILRAGALSEPEVRAASG